MFAEFIYCYILRPWPLREITNFIIKKIIPEKIKTNTSIIYLNPNDPVISGALFFGVYEKSETKFLNDICFEGMKVIDIGANVGYYSALTSDIVGPEGIVLAIEPDPESFKYLLKTIQASKFKNIRPFLKAASDHNNILPLFISKDNRGDNRLYQTNQKRDYINVKTIRLDELIIENEIDQIDLIKIDVQGYEPKAIRGMEKIITSSKKIILLTEFWPKGIIDAGENPYDFLEMLRNFDFLLYELNKKGKLVLLRKEDDAKLIYKYRGRKYTNLVGKKI